MHVIGHTMALKTWRWETRCLPRKQPPCKCCSPMARRVHEFVCKPMSLEAPDKSRTTLRSSLSGTFLQTLPDLVTPLKGHSLSPRSCPPTRSAPPKGLSTDHIPSTAFRHLPPHSVRFSYATEGALFISALLSTDTVSVLRKVRVLIIMTVEAT